MIADAAKHCSWQGFYLCYPSRNAKVAFKCLCWHFPFTHEGAISSFAAIMNLKLSVKAGSMVKKSINSIRINLSLALGAF